MSLRCAGVLFLVAIASSTVQAQEEAELPAPTLPDEPAEAEPPAERPQVLMRIRGGQVVRGDAEPEEEESEPLPEDIPFVVPGDTRVGPTIGAPMRGPPPDEAPPPIPFLVSAGAGFSRLLAGPQDYLRIEQMFIARIPQLSGFRVGVGIAELIGPQIAFQGGPRVSMSAGFCHVDWIECEGTVHLQPGIFVGELFTNFDLHAALDLRFLFGRIIDVAATGGFSFVAGGVFIHVGGQVGIVFG